MLGRTVAQRCTRPAPGAAPRMTPDAGKCRAAAWPGAAGGWAEAPTAPPPYRGPVGPSTNAATGRPGRPGAEARVAAHGHRPACPAGRACPLPQAGRGGTASARGAAQAAHTIKARGGGPARTELGQRPRGRSPSPPRVGCRGRGGNLPRGCRVPPLGAAAAQRGPQGPAQRVTCRDTDLPIRAGFRQSGRLLRPRSGQKCTKVHAAALPIWGAAPAPGNNQRLYF